MNNTSMSVAPCDEYLDNITALLTPMRHTRNISDAANQALLIRHIIHDYALPFVCAFGIVGNMLNLLVLTRKQLKGTMDRMEKSAHLGLLALAISDMCFCVLALFVAFLPSKLVFTSRDFIGVVYYKYYHQPLLNIFVITSTWLTVIMALGRYVAICHPLHARGFINLNGTLGGIIGVFVGSVLVNLPQFWYTYVSVVDCAAEAPHCVCNMYTKVNTDLRKNYAFVLGYNISYSIIGIFIPLIILTYCNVCLIQALRQSFKMQQMYRANQPKDSGQRITPTLISIIILFTILVSPAELLKFFENFIRRDQNKGSPRFYVYQSATEITNFLMVINFAINFVLYCVINVQFRRTVREIVCCKCASRKSKYVKANHHEQTNMTMTCNVSDIETEM